MTWSLKVVPGSGTPIHELNDGIAYFTNIPELEDLNSAAAVLIEVPNTTPVFVRMQPAETTISIQIQMTACDEATYHSRRAQIASWLPLGLVTLKAQMRGMPSPVTFVALVTGYATNYQQRSVVVSATVPAGF